MSPLFKKGVLLFVGGIPWIIGAAVSVWVFQQHVPANGVREIQIPFTGQSPWFEAFLPGQRASGILPQEGGWVGQKVTDEPVYARVRSPGAYDHLTLGLEMRAKNQPLIEIGMGPETEDGAVEMQPAWSEALARGFHPVSFQGKQGFVRDGLPDSVLLTASPETTLFWHATSTGEQQMDTQEKAQKYTVSLRGAHDFYVIPVNGKIEFTFRLQDSNRSTTGHSIAFQLMRDQALLWSEAMGTTGERALHPEAVFEKKLAFDHLSPGVYRLSLFAQDGIFVRGFSTLARHWVIGPRVYFGDEVGYSTSTQPIAVWTNSRHLEAKTVHQEGLQTIGLGSARTTVDQTHVAFPLSRLPNELAGEALFRALKGDIWIVGDGYVSFDREALFLPYPRRLTDASDPIREGIQAVITPYHPPQQMEDGWMRPELTTALDSSQNRVRVVLSAPGIVSRGGEVDVRAVQATFKRPPRTDVWWQYLWTELKGALHRLRFTYA